MATKSFLNKDELEYAKRHFTPDLLGTPFSRWLAERLEEKVSAVPNWLEAKPIALGSWGREELSPDSDLDVIFLGTEEIVQEVVGRLQSQGFRLRSRLPEDHRDWTVGVEPFDTLALLRAKVFSTETAEALKTQQKRILESQLQIRRKLRRSISTERKLRQGRHDSIANYLEPNLKYGPGGLRDLQQALDLRRLFASQYDANDGIEEALRGHKQFLIAVRQRLHILGGGDILSGSLQSDLANFFAYDDAKRFMKDLQLRLADVSFYADWVFQRSKATSRRIAQIQRRKLTSLDDGMSALEADSSILMQEHLRRLPDNLPGSEEWSDRFRINKSEDFLVGLFDSQILDRVMDDLRRVRGLVQLDHYHRFTVDAHLRQAVRELKRVHDHPSRLGKMARWVRELSRTEWQILLWTALFHDLAKGLGGDHSLKGAELARRDLKRWRVSEDLIQEVSWMVGQHLLLSTAAFRMDLRSPTTWHHLEEHGVSGRRLPLLSVFTAIDIRATNPEAWTPWKERLLVELLEIMESEEASRFLRLQSHYRQAGGEWLTDFDPSLTLAIPQKVLLEDLSRLTKGEDLMPKALRNRKGEIWIRFHHRQDRAGQFLEYVSRLYALGCSIQQSSVRTLPQIGVYDWFHVRTKKSPAQIMRQLSLMQNVSDVTPRPLVQFQKIEVVSHHNDEAIISFRGRDQKGLLLAAAQALFEAGLAIRWAKVHTWGGQVDDVFCVLAPKDLDPLISALRSRWESGFAAS